MTLDSVFAFLDSSPTVRLLKADLGPFVVFFLRQTFKSRTEDSSIVYSHDDLLQLTRYSEAAIRFVDNALSRDTRLVGTESRLRLVIDTLVDLVRGASSDPGRRLKDLLAERQRIDDEIESVRGGGKVETYHPAQIRERFHTAVDLLKTLQGDFRAVEDRFEEIGGQVQSDALTPDG